MIEILEKNKCCGCYGCVNICPKKCISMKYDNEGFAYPVVDKEKCVNCGLCEKACPTFKNLNLEKYNYEGYVCYNTNEEARKSSSSGGIFILLCEEVINKKGVVFGASFDENFIVKHSYAETLEGCKKFKGSKYVQSQIGDTYKQAKKFLEEGRIVLFSGTQCQIKGLNLFLNKKYENLLAVDIICHGVPSPMVFEKYKEILKIVPNDYQKYLIEPEVNTYDDLESKINNAMLVKENQLSIFNSTMFSAREYNIKKDFNTIIGKYLFIIGKVLAIDNDGLIELIDIKKIEGYLFEFKNIDLCNNKRIGGK